METKIIQISMCRATTELRVLSEVLEVVNGKPLPGIIPINIIKQSLVVVLMDKKN